MIAALAHALPWWFSAVLLPLLQGFVKELWAEYLRSKKHADDAAAAQREADRRANAKIAAEAKERGDALAAESDADVDRGLSGWIVR